jgi:hypothetical protein
MQRAQRVAPPLDVALDGVPAPRPRARWPRGRTGLFEVPDVLERIPRHESCQHALLHREGLRDPLPVRFMDPTRRFVPRRLSVPLTPAPVMIEPGFFPGAAYGPGELATGIRGRVVRGPPGDQAPVRWCRALARTAGGEIVGRAHGDDRGEILLLLAPEAGTIGDLQDPLDLEVTVYARLTVPPPANPLALELDPLWDLPLEPVSATTDDAARGLTLPAGYVATATSVRTVSFTLGRLRSEPDFVFSNT